MQLMRCDEVYATERATIYDMPFRVVAKLLIDLSVTEPSFCHGFVLIDSLHHHSIFLFRARKHNRP